VKKSLGGYSELRRVQARDVGIVGGGTVVVDGIAVVVVGDAVAAGATVDEEHEDVVVRLVCYLSAHPKFDEA